MGNKCLTVTSCTRGPVVEIWIVGSIDSIDLFFKRSDKEDLYEIRKVFFLLIRILHPKKIIRIRYTY